MRLALVVDRGAVSEGPSARQWLACTEQAGLTRPPIPQRGLGRGLSGVGGSFAPPAAFVGGTARQMARRGPLGHGAAVDDGRVAQSTECIGLHCFGIRGIGGGC